MKRVIRSSASTPLTLDQQAMMDLLQVLDAKLRSNDMRGEIELFGGAVMCLGLNARESTHDIDAIFEPKADIRKLIAEVAAENDLPEDWMNDAVKGFISDNGEFTRFGSDKFTNLTVFMTRPEYLFAMKCLACRLSDETASELGDIKFLADYLEIDSVDAAEALILKYYPADRYKPKTHYMLCELFGEE